VQKGYSSLNIIFFQILYRRLQFAEYCSLSNLIQKGHNSRNITAFWILYRRARIRWILQTFRSCTEGPQCAEYYSLSDLVQKGHNSLNITAFQILYRRATIRWIVQPYISRRKEPKFTAHYSLSYLVQKSWTLIFCPSRFSLSQFSRPVNRMVWTSQNVCTTYEFPYLCLSLVSSFRSFLSFPSSRK
jgi:hypothetical protein